MLSWENKEERLTGLMPILHAMRTFAIILFVSSTIIAGEHAFGFDLGSGSIYYSEKGKEPEYSFAWSIHYTYFTKNNFSISANYFQSNWNYRYIMCIDPGVGYRIFIFKRIYSGIEAGMGFTAYGVNGEIPGFGMNGFAKISANASIFPWFQLGICDVLMQVFNNGKATMNQITLECLFLL
jgi:hypothetical protein